MTTLKRTRLNSLSGNAWVKLSKNTWITQKLLAWSGKVALNTDSSFLINTKKSNRMNERSIDETRVKLIRLFTQKGQTVFDPDLQHGDTLTAVLHAECQFIGIANTAQERESAISQLDYTLRKRPYQLFDRKTDQDCLHRIENASIHFLLTEIPLFDFKRATITYEAHLEQVKSIVTGAMSKLAPRSYIALIVPDQRYQGKYYCRHGDLMQLLKKTSLTSQGLINVIQDRQALTAYGYPSTYVPNIINQFVILFRK